MGSRVRLVVMPASVQDVSSTFASIWGRYSRQILARESKVDVDGPHGPIYTLVCRFPPDLAARIQRALGLAGRDWSPHYVYPPSTIHVTILYLSPYLGIGPGIAEEEERRRVARARDIVAEPLRAAGPLRFRARGFNVFPTTVFLQLLPSDLHAPRALRRELADRLRAARFPRSSPSSYEETLAWDLAFANVVRFQQPAAPSLVSAVENLRDVDFGEVMLKSVDLVRTDKVLSDEGTVSLARFELTEPT